MLFFRLIILGCRILTNIKNFVGKWDLDIFFVERLPSHGNDKPKAVLYSEVGRILCDERCS